MLVLGILFFLGGWILIGNAPNIADTGTNAYGSDIVNIPSLVTTSVTGLLAALVGATLFGAAMVRRHVADWSNWLRVSK